MTNGPAKASARSRDRTREHLGTSDVDRDEPQELLRALDEVDAGGRPPGLAQPEVAASRIGPEHGGRVRTGRESTQWWRTEVETASAPAPPGPRP
jgi:hypothetical protein